MKLKIKLICTMLVCIFILTGCVDNNYPFDQEKYDEYSLLKVLEKYEYKSDEVYEQTCISIDKETGVNYIVIMGVIKGQVYFNITPRYDSEGNIIIMPID